MSGCVCVYCRKLRWSDTFSYLGQEEGGYLLEKGGNEYELLGMYSSIIIASDSWRNKLHFMCCLSSAKYFYDYVLC